MSTLAVALLFAAGFLPAVVNAVAGGGPFITVAALRLTGVPPITASATPSIAQRPGYVTAMLACRAWIKGMWRSATLLAVVSMIGALGAARSR